MAFLCVVSTALLPSLTSSAAYHSAWPQMPMAVAKDGSADACKTLQALLPDQVLLPDSPEYNYDQNEYWTLQQTELHPHCRILPHSALDVRNILDVAVRLNTSIAVVSGGHSSNKSASNIDNGVTIDLSALLDVVLSEDEQSVWLGPGAKWSQVYADLERHGLTVPGGRVGHVGVGGYVLGGGFSWYANQEGWTCDSVMEFEVVTPDLEILKVNSDSHPDLFWALKGSLGAFGIVTAIKMKTLPLTGFYGGAISYQDNEETFTAISLALKGMANNAETELATAGYISYAFVGQTKDWIYNTYLVNTANSSTSAAIGNFLMIPNKGHTLRHMTPRESADDIAASNPLGFRRSKFTLTILPTMEAMQAIHSLMHDFADDMQRMGNGDVSDELLGITYQPLTTSHLRVRSNIFSKVLTPLYGPLLLVSVDLWWKDETKDAYYEREFRALYEEGLMWGLGWMRVLHAWLYPNYAATWQEPLSEWHLGRRTVERLESVRSMYDSRGRWKGLVPGVWHV